MPQKRRGSAVIPLLPLLLTVILLLVCPRDAIAQETQPEPEPEDIGCNEIPFYPIEDHCALTRNCSFEHRIPWHKLYYCYVEPEGISAKAPFLVMLAFLFLPIMLLILMDAAVMFFSPNVSIIAQLTNMRPRVAGVTLLAIGNVAPDISSGVLAMVSGSPSLALGAIVGAGCFVQMIVLSQVIITAGSAKCSLGMVRIIATYAVGAAILLIYLCIGQITIIYCALILLLYFAFVLMVVYDVQLSRWARSLQRTVKKGAAQTHSWTLSGRPLVGDGARTSSGRIRVSEQDDMTIEEKGRTKSGRPFSWDRVKESLNRRRAEKIMGEVQFEPELPTTAEEPGGGVEAAHVQIAMTGLPSSSGYISGSLAPTARTSTAGGALAKVSARAASIGGQARPSATGTETSDARGTPNLPMPPISMAATSTEPPRLPVLKKVSIGLAGVVSPTPAPEGGLFPNVPRVGAPGLRNRRDPTQPLLIDRNAYMVMAMADMNHEPLNADVIEAMMDEIRNMTLSQPQRRHEDSVPKPPSPPHASFNRMSLPVATLHAGSTVADAAFKRHSFSVATFYADPEAAAAMSSGAGAGSAAGIRRGGSSLPGTATATPSVAPSRKDRDKTSDAGDEVAEVGEHCAKCGCFPRACLFAGNELTQGNCGEWLFDMPWYLGYARFLPFLLLSPIYLLMRASTPLVDPEFFSPFWMLVSSFLFPLFFLFYMGDTIWSLTSFGIALGVGATVAVVTLMLLRQRTDPRQFNAWMVGKVDVCTLMYSLIGMGTAALWVATFAGELVGAVSLVGVEVGIPLSLLGMCFIGVGNSVGDMVNNIAVAKLGLPEMAISAVFASHIMNLCISSGIGLLLLLVKTMGSITATYYIYSPPEAIMALALLIAYDIALIMLAFRNDFTFHVKATVWMARLSYVAFLIMAITLSIYYDGAATAAMGHAP